MKHLTKRIFSIALCVMLTLSMLTAIVLPAAAVEAETPVDPYAKITVKDGTNEPTDNVFFFNAFWATEAPAADEETFEYEYAGNGETYTLTWGKNAFATMADCMTQMETYATAWVADTEMNSDFVAVFAPGNYGGNTTITAIAKTAGDSAVGPTFSKVYKLASRAGTAVPTADKLLNVYMLGAKAGVNPVNDKRDNKADAKKAQNGRSVSDATESVLTDTFVLPKNSNFTLDGFAGSVNACITTDVASDQYIDISIENYFVRDLTAPMANMMFYCYDGGGGKPADVLWNFKNCFFDINKEMNYTFEGASFNYNYNQLTANKIVFDNCAFLHATPATPNVAAKREPLGHSMFLLPTLPSYATAAAAFLGDYATSPEISIKDCIVADWATETFFRIAGNNNRYRRYWETQDQVTVNIVGNKFYDYGVDHQRNSSFIQFSKWSDPATDATNATKEVEALVFNVQHNLFSASDELGADPDKKRFTQFFDLGDASGGNKVYSELKHFTIKENIFQWPNAATNDGNYIINPFFGQYDYNLNLDVSANLFIDNQNHVIANGVRNFRHNAIRTQSDAYVSAAMDGGVRETFSVKDIQGGAVLYNYIQLDALYNASYRSTNLDSFIGAVTVLLERDKDYTADETLFTFGSDEVVFDGVYSDEACTTKVDTLNQDMFKNDAKYFLKAHYTETANGMTTTASVVLAINSPKEYIVIAPEGSEYDTNKSYTFNGVTYTDGATAQDGVAATFSTKLDGAEVGLVDNVYAENYIANNSSQTATANSGTVFGLQSLILLTPGTVGIGTTDYLKGSKSMAIVGPQWNASPYGAENATGELAGGRSVDGANEARLPISFRNNNERPGVSYSFHGVVFCHNDYGAMVFNAFEDGRYSQDNPETTSKNEAKARTAHSDYESLNIKNCVFDTQSTSYGLVGGFRNTFDCYADGKTTEVELNGLTLDMRVQDSVYAGANQTKIPSVFFGAEASRKVIKNFAILTKNCVSEETLVNAKYEEPVCNWKTDSSKPITSGLEWYAKNHAATGDPVSTVEPTWDTAGEHTYNCTCGKSTVIKKIVVAKVSNDENATNYQTLSKAVAAAKEGDTVTLQYDVEGTTELLFVRDGITFDLNGHQLTVDHVVALKGAAVIDSSAETTGKLLVAQNRVALDKENNGYLPVYDDTGYIFTAVSDVLITGRQAQEGSEYAFSPLFDTAAHEALAAGAADSGVQIVIRITWSDATYDAIQDFTYLDSMVKDVIESYGKNELYPENYASAFTALLKATPDVNVGNLVVSAAIISATGVEITSAGITHQFATV